MKVLYLTFSGRVVQQGVEGVRIIPTTPHSVMVTFFFFSLANKPPTPSPLWLINNAVLGGTVQFMREISIQDWSDIKYTVSKL